jgi:MFS family permease
MEANGRDAVVRRYYVYQLTATVGFVTPIFTLFVRSRGLLWSEVATLSAILWVVVTVGEVPTGYVGDRIGRRNSLVASTALMVGSLVGFVLTRSFLAFAVLYAVWALGMTFKSGAESAWLYEVLDDRDLETEFTRIRGRAGSIERWAGVLAMVGGGFLFVLEPWLPFLVGAAWHALGIPLLLTLPRNDSDADEAEGSLGVSQSLGIVRRALFRPPLRSVVLYVGLLFGAVGAANTYVQPIAVDVVESGGTGLLATLPLPRVPAEATLGFLYAGFTAVSAVASYHAGTVEQYLGGDRAILLIPPAVGVVLVSPAAVPAVAIPTFFLMRSADPVVRPIVNRRLNEEIGSAGRATVLSAASMAYGVVRIPLVLAGGVIADAFAPLVAVSAFGVVLVVGTLATRLVETPANRAGEATATAD